MKRGAGTPGGAPGRAAKRPCGAPAGAPAPGAALWRPPGRAPAAALDPRLGEADPHELLRRLLAPLGVAAFARDAWAQRAVALPGPPARLRALVRGYLHDLDLRALAELTPSEAVHAWLRPEAPGAPLESVAVGAEAALRLAASGAALYFRAPEELEALLVPGLATALGTAFAGRHPGDGRPRGEIELFAAQGGHVTGWHTDFQHNFTLQLRGSKTWRFRRGPVRHNIRALTPHYRTRENLEQQMKVHLVSGPSAPEFEPPREFFEAAEEVTLTEGDVLYHPAGIWHRVECGSGGGVSLNVSLTAATWADLLSDGLRQLLWTSPALRAPVAGLADAARGREQLRGHIAELRRLAGSLEAEELLPPGALDAPGPEEGAVDVATTRLGAGLAVAPGDRLRLSRLAVAVALPGAEGEEARGASGPSSGAHFAVHVNFGNEECASWLRTRLAVPRSLEGAMAWLQARQLAARGAEARGGPRSRAGAWSFLASDLLTAAGGSRAPGWPAVRRLLRALCHLGYLRAGGLGRGG